MARPHVFEGTLEEIAEQLRSAGLSGRLKVTVNPEEIDAAEQKGATPEGGKSQAKKCVSALGRYAFVPGGSEEFARRKQEEIEREDRPRS